MGEGLPEGTGRRPAAPAEVSGATAIGPAAGGGDRGAREVPVPAGRSGPGGPRSDERMSGLPSGAVTFLFTDI